MAADRKTEKPYSDIKVDKLTNTARIQFFIDEALKRPNLLEQDTSKHEKASPRMQFKEMWVYIMCILNMTIGTGNIVNFPKSCYKYEGGTFLLVYLIVLSIYVVPIAYLELIMGQYHRGSLLLVVQRCVPILQAPVYSVWTIVGLGWFSALSAFFLSISYQFEVAIQLKFFLALLTVGDEELSLNYCNNTWNTGSCYELFNDACVSSYGKTDDVLSHGMYNGKCNVPYEELQNLESAEFQFLQLINKVSGSILEFDNFNRGTFMALSVLWLTHALMQNRGVYNCSKTISVSMILVFLFVPVLMFSSLKLEGALDGVKNLMIINWQAVMNTEIWIEALQRASLSIGVGFGSFIAMASFSPPEAHTFKVLMIDVILDTVMNIMCTATVFATLGYMSFQLGGSSIYSIVPMADSDMIAHVILPVLIRGVSDQSSLWILMYYFVMTVVGWGSMFSTILVISSTIADSFNISSKKYSFNKISIGVCVFMTFFGLLMCFESGSHWAGMFANLSFAMQFVTILLEVVIMSEYYGVSHIYEDIQVVMGKPVLRLWGHLGYISPGWRVFWDVSPALSMFMALFAIFHDFPFSKNSRGKPYFYEITKCLILLVSVLVVPFFMIVSSMVMKRHVEENEKKQFDSRVMWMKQKQLRSWNRIELQLQNTIKDGDSNSINDEIEEIFEKLPENPPNDLEGNWRLINRPFFKKRGTRLPSRQERRKVTRKSSDQKWEKMLLGSEKPKLQKPKLFPAKLKGRSSNVQHELNGLISKFDEKPKIFEKTAQATTASMKTGRAQESIPTTDNNGKSKEAMRKTKTENKRKSKVEKSAGSLNSAVSVGKSKQKDKNKEGRNSKVEVHPVLEEKTALTTDENLIEQETTNQKTTVTTPIFEKNLSKTQENSVDEQHTTTPTTKGGEGE